MVTNPYDVSMGKSVGLEVQAISKSGNNSLQRQLLRLLPRRQVEQRGSVHPRRPAVPEPADRRHHRRPDRPRQDALLRRLRARANPNTINLHPAALAPQNVDVDVKDDKYTFLGRIDHQFSNRDHFVVRGNYFNRLLPNDVGTPANAGGTTASPSRATKKDITSYFVTGNWSHAGSAGTLQELRVGYYRYYWTYGAADGLFLTPEYKFPGLTIGLNWNYPEFIRQARLPIPLRRDAASRRARPEDGRRVSIGLDDGDWPARERGQWFFSPLPAGANAVSRSTGPRVLELHRPRSDGDPVRPDLREDYQYNVPRKTYAGWLPNLDGEPRLTLNLGVRYDMRLGRFRRRRRDRRPRVCHRQRQVHRDVGYRNDIRDLNNFGPRVGFAWNVGGKSELVIRGGTGIFYSGIGANPAFDSSSGTASA